MSALGPQKLNQASGKAHIGPQGFVALNRREITAVSAFRFGKTESKPTAPVVRIESLRLRNALQNDVNAMIDSTKSKQREDAAGIRQVQRKYSRGTHRVLTVTEDAAGIRQVSVLTGHSRGTQGHRGCGRHPAGQRTHGALTGYSRGTQGYRAIVRSAAVD